MIAAGSRAWLRAIAIAATLVTAPLAVAEPVLVALAPPASGDARQAVAIGPHGEVYAPDGKGAWTRTQAITTADTLAIAGRVGEEVVASGEGTVYKLAPNGWSAFRLHQKDKAVMAAGTRAVAAVKRQLFALHLSARGEPEKLALAPAPVLAIGAGKAIVIATERGLARVTKGKVEPIAGAPKQVSKLVDDRWALLAAGAYDLIANKTIAWPGGAIVATATTAAAGSLIAVARHAGKLELFTVDRALARETLPLSPSGVAVGVVADRVGRIVIAFADGRLAIRERGTWTTVQVSSALPVARPGAGPARSP